MLQLHDLLKSIPVVYRDALLNEYKHILQNYMEHRWGPSELSGGKFVEIVYSIIFCEGEKAYGVGPSKPQNMVEACRRLENYTMLCRSFRILIPRLLPVLYEVRNNRGVGHVGGDVDANHMDATFVVSSVNWIMAELVRIKNDVSTEDAQDAVDRLSEYICPIIWEKNDIRRILDTSLKLEEKLLLLLVGDSEVSVSNLLNWSEYKNQSRFKEVLRRMHVSKLVEFDELTNIVHILPPGNIRVQKIMEKKLK